jgi:hypothetical protein
MLSSERRHRRSPGKRFRRAKNGSDASEALPGASERLRALQKSSRTPGKQFRRRGKRFRQRRKRFRMEKNTRRKLPKSFRTPGKQFSRRRKTFGSSQNSFRGAWRRSGSSRRSFRGSRRVLGGPGGVSQTPDRCQPNGVNGGERRDEDRGEVGNAAGRLDFRPNLLLSRPAALPHPYIYIGGPGSAAVIAGSAAVVAGGITSPLSLPWLELRGDRHIC